jgi:hypothetical protein
VKLTSLLATAEYFIMMVSALGRWKVKPLSQYQIHNNVALIALVQIASFIDETSKLFVQIKLSDKNVEV